MSGEYIEMSGNISLHPDGKNPDINSVRLEGESNMIMNVDELNVDDDNTQNYLQLLQRTRHQSHSFLFFRVIS